MWKEIEAYQGKYLISKNGEVKSVARIKSNNQPIPERILKQSTDSSGYKYVSLYNEELKKNKRYRVHRLVAVAFLPNPENKEVVNHKNGIKSDNFVENLEWATYGENKSHSFKELGETHWLTGKTGKNNPYSKSVEQLDLEGNVINTFSSVQDITRKLGFGQGNISAVCRGERKTANGCKWRYV